MPIAEPAPVVTPPVPEPTPAEPGEFHLAAYRDGPLGLSVMSNDVVLVGARAFAEAGPGADLSRRPDMIRGLLEASMDQDNDWVPLPVGGRWPDSTYISGTLLGHRFTSPALVYARKGARWQRQRNIEGPLQWHYAAFAPWTDGQTLALRVMSISAKALEKYEGDPPPAVQKRHAAALAAATPRLDVIDPAPGAAAPPRFPAGVTVRTFTALPGGQIDAIVEDTAGTRTLLRWAPGAAEPARFVLPATGETPGPMTLVTHVDGSLWVAAPLAEASYLARFDGATWTPRALPAKQPLRSLSTGADGLLWAVTGPERFDFESGETRTGTLWNSADGERWQEVKLPGVRFADLAEKHYEQIADESSPRELYPDPAAAKQRRTITPVQVLSRGAGDVWVLGLAAIGPRMDQEDFTRDVLLRTRAVETPLRLPSDDALRLELLDEAPVAPVTFDPTADCGAFQRLTLLMTLPAGTPRTGPVPQVEALLRAHPELIADIGEIWEAQHHGHRVAAFMLDGMEEDRGPALLAALAEVVPEKRSFACRQPIPIRPLYTPEQMSAAASPTSPPAE